MSTRNVAVSLCMTKFSINGYAWLSEIKTYCLFKLFSSVQLDSQMDSDKSKKQVKPQIYNDSNNNVCKRAADIVIICVST